MVAVLFGIKISQERFGSLEISSCVPAVASGRAERVSLQRKHFNNWLMTTFALNNLWAYLQGLSLSQSDREWLAKKLIMPKETTLIEDDNARLDEALEKFSGDFGGSADAMAVAEELRQGAEMVKEVDTW